MTRRLGLLMSGMMTMALWDALLPAQGQMTESPIAPGIWSFPSRKTAAAKDIAAACADHFQIRFAEGRFLGIKMRGPDKARVPREVDEVGRCSFKRDTATDRCDVKLIHADGSILGGTIEMKYALDADKVLKFTATPKMITDSPVANAPFDAYPVRCPDDSVWNVLNDLAPK
jgi:hypothetical protein